MNILFGLGVPVNAPLFNHSLSAVPRAKAPARAVRLTEHDSFIPWYTTGFE